MAKQPVDRVRSNPTPNPTSTNITENANKGLTTDPNREDKVAASDINTPNQDLPNESNKPSRPGNLPDNTLPGDLPDRDLDRPDRPDNELPGRFDPNDDNGLDRPDNELPEGEGTPKDETVPDTTPSNEDNDNIGPVETYYKRGDNVQFVDDRGVVRAGIVHSCKHENDTEPGQPLGKVLNVRIGTFDDKFEVMYFVREPKDITYVIFNEVGDILNNGEGNSEEVLKESGAEYSAGGNTLGDPRPPSVQIEKPIDDKLRSPDMAKTHQLKK